VVEIRLGDHHAGEERAQRERHVEQHGGPHRDADRYGQHAERGQLS